MDISTLIGIAVGIIGAIIGVTGWLSGRDKKTSADGEWRGVVNTKLDTIGTAIISVSGDIKCVQNTLNDHGKILAAHGTELAEHGTAIANLGVRVSSAEQRISKRKVQAIE